MYKPTALRRQITNSRPHKNIVPIPCYDSRNWPKPLTISPKGPWPAVPSRCSTNEGRVAAPSTHLSVRRIISWDWNWLHAVGAPSISVRRGQEAARGRPGGGSRSSAGEGGRGAPIPSTRPEWKICHFAHFSDTWYARGVRLLLLHEEAIFQA